MKGVEILSKKEIVTEVSFGWKLFWSLFVVYFIAFATVSVWIWINKNDLNATIKCLLIGIVFGVLFGYFAGIASGDPIDYITEYKVIFSGDVPMNEFMAKYEIVDQDGRIYTVREKNRRIAKGEVYGHCFKFDWNIGYWSNLLIINGKNSVQKK